MAQKLETIVITGASSGIGAALALYYAQEGRVLGLTGRNAARLDEIALACRGKGAEIVCGVVDVCDRDGMAAWLSDFDDAHEVDLVIANAGISAGTDGVINGEKPEQVRRVFDVNLTGVLNTVEPLLGRMVARGGGQIALMSSLAGFRGWPGAPAYCASKAAVRVYGEALRGAMREAGVRVNVICPGFVVSRMTAVNDFPMPFLMQADRAASLIAKGLARNKGRISFPLLLFLVVWGLAALPDFMAQSFLCKTPSKSGT